MDQKIKELKRIQKVKITNFSVGKNASQKNIQDQKLESKI